MSRLSYRRMTANDAGLATALFEMMAAVFEEARSEVARGHVEQLLRREDFIAIGAFFDREPVGGLTAFLLPLTRSARNEIFLYDIAVRPSHQRLGIGRHLVRMAREIALASGAQSAWVAADNEDEHALDFYRAIGGEGSPATIFAFYEA